jgi:hypothetical protein
MSLQEERFTSVMFPPKKLANEQQTAPWLNIFKFKSVTWIVLGSLRDALAYYKLNIYLTLF